MLGSHGSLDKEGGPLFSPGIPRANAVMGSAVRPRQGAIDRALATDHNVLSRRIKFKPAARPDKQDEELRRKHTPLNVLAPLGNAMNGSAMHKKVGYGGRTEPKKNVEEADHDGLKKPARVLFQPERIEELLRWRGTGRAGAGLVNFGNTCFLNSVLQALTHTAPLTNYFLSGEHSKQCRLAGQTCAMCEMQRHIQAAMTSGRVVKPLAIVNKLKVWAKHFRKGRQEDAHEFLRYFIDGMQRACLAGMEKQLDHASKATTFVHQAFGSYLRSQVKCTECNHDSNTYDAALDMSLDIKHARSVEKALESFTKAEMLEKANKYNCGQCKKKVVAKKRFTLHTAPAVLTVHLKRFDFTYRQGQKITKHVEFDEYLDLSPYMSKSDPGAKYRLYAVVVHSGHTIHSGHYYSYVRAPSQAWYRMDDDSVSMAGLHNVLREQAYMLFYQRIPGNKPSPLEVPLAKPIPAAANEIGERVEKQEELIVHIKADENRGLTRVNGVVARGSFWEVLEFEDSACSRQKRPCAVFRVEIAPTAVRAKRRKLALDHDDDDDDDEPAANIMPSTVTASKNVRVKSWDESLRADDLARRVRTVEQPKAAAGSNVAAKWDGRMEQKEDVVQALRARKFAGFGGAVSTWDGDKLSLVDSVAVPEPKLYNYKYTEDDMAIDMGRTKKVKVRTEVQKDGTNHFQAYHQWKKGQKGATEDDDEDPDERKWD